MSFKNRTSTLAVAALVATAAAAVLVSPLSVGAQEYRRDPGRPTLEGTWWVQVTALSDCTSRKPLASFAAILTFARGGTMTGTTTNPVFAVGQRGPDHGVWSRAGGRHYQASSAAFLLFTSAPNPPANPGFQAGYQRLDQAITLTDADHFASDAVTQFYDTAGNKYREGCATATARRFE